MILAAADGDGVLFKDPHVRRRLARIDEGHPRPFQQGCDLVGIGRNAAYALQIVQAYPFGRQDGPHTADDFGQFLAFMDFIAIFDEELEPDLVVQQSKGPGKDIEAGDDAVLFAQEFRFTLAVFRQNGIGRHVFTGDVFLHGL